MELYLSYVATWNRKEKLYKKKYERRKKKTNCEAFNNVLENVYIEILKKKRRSTPTHENIISTNLALIYHEAFVLFLCIGKGKKLQLN